MIERNKLNNDLTSRLCNIMVNCQELVEDLEKLEDHGLFKQQLKSTSKRLLSMCMSQVDSVFGIGQRKVVEAIRAKKSEDEIEALKKEVQTSNGEMLHVYDMAIRSRVEYHSLSFNQRLLVLRLLKDIDEGNVKYVGDDLYYNIKSSDELNFLENES